MEKNVEMWKTADNFCVICDWLMRVVFFYAEILSVVHLKRVKLGKSIGFYKMRFLLR